MTQILKIYRISEL